MSLDRRIDMRKHRKDVVAPISMLFKAVLLFAFVFFIEMSGLSVAQTVPIVSGNARFTVLSPTLMRVEYAADGTFDNAVS
jgi:hypothetical protein